MGHEMELATSDTDGDIGAEDFLAVAGEDELRAFLRRLPMVASQQEGPFTLRDLIYEMKLSPFVKCAWKSIDGSPGIPGRLMQMMRVYAKAEADFEAMTGETRRLPRKINLPSFIEIYTTAGPP